MAPGKSLSISEITGIEGDIISMQEIFAFRKTGLAENGTVIGEFAATGIRPRLSERLAASGVNLPPSMFESHPGPLKRYRLMQFLFAALVFLIIFLIFAAVSVFMGAGRRHADIIRDRLESIEKGSALPRMR